MTTLAVPNRVQLKNILFAAFAWLLLLLMVLDLSTARLYTAGTFPLLDARADIILSGSSAEHAQPVQSVPRQN